MEMCSAQFHMKTRMHKMSLKGKNIIVTGGAGGIGVPLCKKLLADGANVTVIARSDSLPFEATLLQGDLSSLEGIEKISEQLKSIQVDILINLAGVLYFGLCEEQSAQDTTTQYMVNLIAPAILTQAVLPQMKNRGDGHIVNIGSTFGTIGFPGYVAYCAAKHAIRGFSEALGRELGDTNIAVIHVSPRATSTDMNSATIEKLNSELGVTMDSPTLVAKSIVSALKHKKKRSQLGWVETFQSRINSLIPGIVDSALARQLPTIKKYIAHSF